MYGWRLCIPDELSFDFPSFSCFPFEGFHLIITSVLIVSLGFFRKFLCSGFVLREDLFCLLFSGVDYVFRYSPFGR